jgi:DNA-directed RNA polymerase specialized sigma24 family protein
MQTGKGLFPETEWALLTNVRDGGPAVKLAALDILIRRYWRPVFGFLKYSGHEEETAKDLTQAFFSDWIENDIFSKVDERKGRFRSFMLSCLKRFVVNAHRDDHAQKRRPAGGFVSLDGLMEDTAMSFVPRDGMTPEVIFERSWATEVVLRVLKHLERECGKTGKGSHYDIFARRIIDPILMGIPGPSLAELGVKHNLTEKQAANHLETARRAYRRLLEEEIRLYAQSSTEVASEVRDIFRILGQQ